MVSRKIVQVTTIAVVICWMMVFFVSTAGSDSNKPASQESKRVWSGGAEGAARHASGPPNTVPGSEGATVFRAVSCSQNVIRHPLDCPSTFLKDGVYIWCDPNGVWTISWWAREYFTLNAILTANKPITVKRSEKAETAYPRTVADRLEISSIPKARGGIVQFVSADDSVEFEILIDGVADPNRVYVGSRLHNPKQFPLELRTRRTLSPSGMPDAESAFHQQESTESTDGYMGLTGSPSRSAVPTGQSHGSGRGGGKVIGGISEGTANK